AASDALPASSRSSYPASSLTTSSFTSGPQAVVGTGTGLMICADAVDAARTLAATVMIIAASERTPRLLVNTDSLHILNSLQSDRGLLNKDLVQGVVKAFQQLMTGLASANRFPGNPKISINDTKPRKPKLRNRNVTLSCFRAFVFSFFVFRVFVFSCDFSRLGDLRHQREDLERSPVVRFGVGAAFGEKRKLGRAQRAWRSVARGHARVE